MHFRNFAFSLVAVILLLPPPEAQSSENLVFAYLLPEQKTDVRHRFDLAENQLVLVEEISEAACLVDMGIDVDANIALISKIRDLFNKVHTGLLTGDETLGLHHGESNSRVIRGLRAVDPQWDQFEAAIDHLLSERSLQDAQRHVFYDLDDGLIDGLNVMATAIRAAYANPNEMLMTEALTLELLARQELLMEKIVKDVCLIAFGWSADGLRDKLNDEVALFEKSFVALRDGVPAMGIRPAPTPQIVADLDEIWDTWKQKSSVLDAIQAEQPVDMDALVNFARANLVLLEKFHDVIAQYEEL